MMGRKQERQQMRKTMNPKRKSQLMIKCRKYYCHIRWKLDGNTFNVEWLIKTKMGRWIKWMNQMRMNQIEMNNFVEKLCKSNQRPFSQVNTLNDIFAF